MQEGSGLQRQSSAPVATDSFWGAFDRLEKEESSDQISVDREIHMWGGLSAPSRSSFPVHLMQTLKKEYPNICKLFRKFSIFPASQNKDERLISMVGRNTGALS